MTHGQCRFPSGYKGRVNMKSSGSSLHPKKPVDKMKVDNMKFMYVGA